MADTDLATEGQIKALDAKTNRRWTRRDTWPLRGVNVSGGESSTPVTYETDAHIRMLASRGHRMVRIPFLWESVQPTVGGALDNATMIKLETTVGYVLRQGMTPVIDVHNYARRDVSGTVRIIGSPQLTQAHFVDLWSRITARTALKNSGCWWGLMNRPWGVIPTGGVTANVYWEQCTQAAINAIRVNDKLGLIQVPGHNNARATEWATTHPKPWAVDPTGLPIIYEAQYFPDTNNTGGFGSTTYAQYAAAAATAGYSSIEAKIQTELGRFANWCANNNVRGFLSGCGWPDDPGWNRAGEYLYRLLDRYGIGATYWSAGTQYEQTYELLAYKTSGPASQALVIEGHPSHAGVQPAVAVALRETGADFVQLFLTAYTGQPGGGTTTPPGGGDPPGGGTDPPVDPPPSTQTVANPLGWVVVPASGVPPDPGTNAVVLSPIPTPCTSPTALTGPRIYIGPGDNPEMLNGMVLAAGTVVSFARGATWGNVRVRIRSNGTSANPVLLTSTGDWSKPAPTFRVTKAGTFKDDGIFAITGPNVHMRDLRFLDSVSIAVNIYPGATGFVAHNVEAKGCVHGFWVRGDWAKIWNCWVRNGVMMSDTPGPYDDYGACGVTIEANDVTISGLTGHDLKAYSPDYHQYGDDGSLAEIWMKGDRLKLQYCYLRYSPRILESGGLGGGNSAQNTTIHGIFARDMTDSPFYDNPDGPYGGVNMNGKRIYDVIANGTRYNQ